MSRRLQIRAHLEKALDLIADERSNGNGSAALAAVEAQVNAALEKYEDLSHDLLTGKFYVP